MSELKRCPFCGGEAEISKHGSIFMTGCKESACTGFASNSISVSELESMNKWNTRYENKCNDCIFTNLSKDPKNESCLVRKVMRLYHFIEDDFGCNKFKRKE